MKLTIRHQRTGEVLLHDEADHAFVADCLRHLMIESGEWNLSYAVVEYEDEHGKWAHVGNSWLLHYLVHGYAPPLLGRPDLI